MLARFVTVLASLCLVTETASAQVHRTAAEKRADEYERRLGRVDRLTAAARIDTHKPIGEFDAYLLAFAYFLSQVSGCGFPELPRERGDRWVAQTRQGFAGSPGPDIIIEKKGGATYLCGQPKIRPKEFLRYAKKSNQAMQGTAR